MTEDLKIYKSGNSYVIEIENEDHTLGNLLSSTLAGVKGVVDAYYELEHPLFRRIKVYVRLEDGYDIKEVLKEALNRIKDMNEAFRKEFIEQAKSLGVEDLS
ncbi:RpoL/Rpb11 RNA polymerase subunit family protein [Acidilobus sp.]|uniref:RpoL/Rpb11 RNA polymerase subunit family protein n=1 Tax=Acidilobus sp. TaxID=1872109 RepID=UPI003CFC93D4